ncbi:MaoC/PaaZ C-terminal domain-containing protein [Advenella mimigardefordensis]|uniref:MaoC-like domain-containing protein n=1 Tax=Advenella mimigardefordensis (strain DSM 17166 / LMG 22922 / DPN7) TaxID=1247726 RepID=W0PBI0_ADVMD|nr:MaoC/PaaZ C-terminal domain-containing protein [Advenella mimigardefordensis]AHG64096.1 MaoC-like domain-containing protein [Advenella mimigardefordensis DPN7]
MKEGLYFEEYAEDWTYQSAYCDVTEEGVANFVELHGFTSPTYTDMNYVKSSREYGGRMAPGLHVLSLAEGLLLHAGLTTRRGIFLMELTPRFLKPVFVGDAIANRVRFKSKRLTSKPDRGVVMTDHEVINWKEEIVLSYTSTRMIRTRQYRDEAA